MGFMTLQNFKDEVQSVLGGRVGVDSRLVTWVNLAYLDVAGAVDFHELDSKGQINSAVGDFDYSVPAGMVSILALYDSLAKYGLREVNIVEYNRQDRTVEGPPKVWARHGGMLYLYPTPADVRTVEVFGRSEPVALAADGDLTILPKIWDAPLWMLAASYGLQALNEDARAVFWYNRAVAYMQSRAADGKVNIPAAPGGQ